MVPADPQITTQHPQGMFAPAHTHNLAGHVISHCYIIIQHYTALISMWDTTAEASWCLLCAKLPLSTPWTFLASAHTHNLAGQVISHCHIIIQHYTALISMWDTTRSACQPNCHRL